MMRVRVQLVLGHVWIQSSLVFCVHKGARAPSNLLPRIEIGQADSLIFMVTSSSFGPSYYRLKRKDYQDATVFNCGGWFLSQNHELEFDEFRVQRHVTGDVKLLNNYIWLSSAVASSYTIRNLHALRCLLLVRTSFGCQYAYTNHTSSPRESGTSCPRLYSGCRCH